uniref:Uncharacterized protein n=1 Tax=viral metagenome TaxID=1070528 RepID=A0A6C0J7W0_9ZZZZ
MIYIKFMLLLIVCILAVQYKYNQYGGAEWDDDFVNNPSVQRQFLQNISNLSDKFVEFHPCMSPITKNDININIDIDNYTYKQPLNDDITVNTVNDLLDEMINLHRKFIKKNTSNTTFWDYISYSLQSPVQDNKERTEIHTYINNISQYYLIKPNYASYRKYDIQGHILMVNKLVGERLKYKDYILQCESLLSDKLIFYTILYNQGKYKNFPEALSHVQENTIIALRNYIVNNMIYVNKELKELKDIASKININTDPIEVRKTVYNIMSRAVGSEFIKDLNVLIVLMHVSKNIATFENVKNTNTNTEYNIKEISSLANVIATIDAEKDTLRYLNVSTDEKIGKAIAAGLQIKYIPFLKSYCNPGSSITSSNIGVYRSFDLLSQAVLACNNNSRCKGFTYNKNKKKYILKNRIRGQTENKNYDCYVKNDKSKTRTVTGNAQGAMLQTVKTDGVSTPQTVTGNAQGAMLQTVKTDGVSTPQTVIGNAQGAMLQTGKTDGVSTPQTVIGNAQGAMLQTVEETDGASTPPPTVSSTASTSSSESESEEESRACTSKPRKNIYEQYNWLISSANCNINAKTWIEKKIKSYNLVIRKLEKTKSEYTNSIKKLIEEKKYLKKLSSRTKTAPLNTVDLQNITFVASDICTDKPLTTNIKKQYKWLKSKSNCRIDEKPWVREEIKNRKKNIKKLEKDKSALKLRIEKLIKYKKFLKDNKI